MKPAGYCRVLALAMIVFGGMTGRAMARPPTEINLSYDAEAGNLHIEARHVTNNTRKHFIRKVIVYNNDEKVAERSYVQQTTASMLIEDFALEAFPGDILRVEAVCNEVGRKETTLVIP